jgi:hypothetical protein
MQRRATEFVRLSAGGEWIRTPGSARDKGFGSEISLWPAFGDVRRQQPQIIGRRRLAAEAGDYRLTPPLHRTWNKKFESSPLQGRVRRTSQARSSARRAPSRSGWERPAAVAVIALATPSLRPRGFRRTVPPSAGSVRRGRKVSGVEAPLSLQPNHRRSRHPLHRANAKSC